MLFISDNVKGELSFLGSGWQGTDDTVNTELDAAEAAGMQVLLAVRPGNPSVAEAQNYRPVETFEDIVLSRD